MVPRVKVLLEGLGQPTGHNVSRLHICLSIADCQNRCFPKGFAVGGHRISETVLLNLIMEYHGGCGRVTFNFPTCFFLRTTRASVFFPACAPLFRQALRLVHCSAANSFSLGNFSYVHSGHLLYIF